MKKFASIVALVALPVAVAGCDKKAETPKAQASADTMLDMAMPAETKMAKGNGTVTAIDPAAGKITLNHGPIAELEWPAMEMGFAAAPGVMKDIKVGDKVRFEIEWDGKAGIITAIEVAP